MNTRNSFYLVTSLFLVWGFLTVLMDSLVPRLREIFELSYFEAGLVQFAFFIAYGFASIPSGNFVKRHGYRGGVTRGLTIMGVGCLILIFAADSRWFFSFLVGLFTIAVGMTLLQVAANPYVCLLGSKEGEASRLNFAQGFNSMGTSFAPIVGAMYFLGTSALHHDEIMNLGPISKMVYYESEAAAVQVPFMIMGVGLIILAFLIRMVKLKDFKSPQSRSMSSLELLGVRSLRIAAISIFLYVGAEVAIGSYMVHYFLEMEVLESIRSSPSLSSFCSTVLNQPIDELDAKAIVGCLVTFYWGGAMIGRFLGFFLNRIVDPTLVISIFGLGAIGMVLTSINTTGLTSMWSILAVGFFNSIMFPTIFSMGLKDIKDQRSEASGILCTAIVGGALIPPLYGLLADMVDFKFAMFLLVVCYAYIILSWHWRPSFIGKGTTYEKEEKVPSADMSKGSLGVLNIQDKH